MFGITTGQKSIHAICSVNIIATMWKRWNKNNTKVLVKYELAIADGTLDEVKGVSGITALSHSECLTEMKKDEWSSEWG